MTSTSTIDPPAVFHGAQLAGCLPGLAADSRFGAKVLEMLAIPTFVLDADGRVMVWNRACERLTGVGSDAVLGSASHWRGFHADRRPTLADLLVQDRLDQLEAFYPSAAHTPGGLVSAESWCDMPLRGSRRYLACDASPIAGSAGQLEAVVQTLRDMTEQRNAQLALEQLATRDGLTGLANRRCFDETLKNEWARALRQGQPLSLLMVDVDKFKAYNDAHGHIGGDNCLKRIATALASEMRASDLVARYGGEEFAVILPNQSLKGAAIVAERIRERVERLRLPRAPGMGDPGQHVTVSIGAATAFAALDTGPQQLVAIADAALYRAKHMGRNRISLPLAESA